MAKSIAIIGASSDRKKFGNKAVRAYAQAGWTVYPVHPKETSVEGHTAYTSIGAVPGPVDRVSIYLPPAVGVKVMPDIAEKGAGEIFLNPGTESPEVLKEAEALGLKPRLACSVVDIGLTPEQFPDA